MSDFAPLRLCVFASQIISRKDAKAQRISRQPAIDMTPLQKKTKNLKKLRAILKQAGISGQ